MPGSFDVCVELPPEHTPSTEGAIENLPKQVYGLEEAKFDIDRLFEEVACGKAQEHGYSFWATKENAKTMYNTRQIATTRCRQAARYPQGHARL